MWEEGHSLHGELSSLALVFRGDRYHSQHGKHLQWFGSSFQTSVSADQKKAGSAEPEVLVRCSCSELSWPHPGKGWTGIPWGLGRNSQGGMEPVGHGGHVVPGQLCGLAAITSDLQMCELPLLHPLGIYAEPTVQISMSRQS